MAAHNSHVPGSLGGDLPEKEQLAYEEGHDADIPSNEGVVPSDRRSLNKDNAIDLEKSESHNLSSRTSDDDLPKERDLEKQQATATEESEEPPDPNVVDWDGPEDPQNPMNWYVDAENAQTYYLEIRSLSFGMVLTFV